MTSRRLGLFALAFGSGFAVLTIEIAGARLIAPVFGLSAVPWTAVIGVILTALAVGNHVGGRLADAGRVPLARILVLAGLTGVLPVVGSGVPWVARDVFGFIPGAVASALVLFAPPVLCLGAVVPYLVRADTESLDSIGRRAGDISAAATGGSILGSFATGFLLLPAMPLPLLLGLTAGALFLMAAAAGRLLGDARATRSALVGALAIPAVGALASGTAPDTLHAEQTLYTSVVVTEREWADGRLVRELWQNGGSSSAEYLATGEPAHVYATVSLEMLEPIIGRMDSVLVLGGAALTLPVAFQELRARHAPPSSAAGRPPVPLPDDGPGPVADLVVDVVEIDPAVTRLAGRYFAYGERERPGIRVFHEDARLFLRRSEASYDLVYLDVFDHLVTVPWTMVTEEALSDMAARLAPRGLFMANVLSPLSGEGTAFLERFQATLDAVFTEWRVYVADPTTDLGATQNLIVVAANDPAAIPGLEAIPGDAPGPTGALPGFDRPEAPVRAEGRPLTDMWAPVEYLQAKVFLEGLRWR